MTNTLSFLLFFCLCIPVQAKVKQKLKDSEYLIVYNSENAEAFGLKRRFIKKKPQYFLTFKRGKQIYKTQLISTKKYNQYIKKYLSATQLKPLQRKPAHSNSACHKQVTLDWNKNTKNICFDDLSKKQQKQLRLFVRELNYRLQKKVSGDLL